MKDVADDQMITSTRAVILAGTGDELRVLLVRRKFPPFDGTLTLPGGYLKGSESSEETIRRKVLKETSINLDSGFSCFKLSSRSHNLDPRGFQITDNYMFVADSSFNCDDMELEGEERPEWYYFDEVEKLGFNHGAILCEALGLLWRELPVGQEKRPAQIAPRVYSAKEINWTEKPITFFSGTFNPWHGGHQACLDLCPNQNIVIVPDSNPWKTQGAHEKRCHWQEYRELAHQFEKSPYGVFPGYFGIEEGNPTVNWFPHVKCDTKEFLMGLDSFFSFPRWKNVAELLNSMDKLYVVPRFTQNKTDGSEIAAQIKEMNPKLEIVFLKEHSYMNVSSTELRKGR